MYAEDYTIGTRGVYSWLTDRKHSLADFTRLCPEAVLERYLAVTSTDSGSPGWWAEGAKNWTYRSGVAYSARVEDVSEVFEELSGQGSGGFDEMYVFTEFSDIGEMIDNKTNPWTVDNKSNTRTLVALVNHFFSPNQPEDLTADLFWAQIITLKPESYLSDGVEFLTFVTRDACLFERAFFLLKSDLEEHAKTTEPRL